MGQALDACSSPREDDVKKKDAPKDKVGGLDVSPRNLAWLFDEDKEAKPREREVVSRELDDGIPIEEFGDSGAGSEVETTRVEEKAQNMHCCIHQSASAANKYVAEFIGTFLLVFTVGMVVSLGQAIWGVFAIAMVLMVMIYALGPISGGNFNPAVSFALFFQGALDLETAINYIISQLIGGFSGALVAGYFVGVDNITTAGPGNGATLIQALGGEYFYTWMLVFVVLNVAVAPAVAGNQYFGLAIALVVVAGGYGEGALSGGAFNPAVSLGLNLASNVYGEGAPKFSLLYPLVHIVAALTAVIMFRIVRPEKQTETTSGPKLISEFLGTFMLVLTVGLNVLSPAKGGSQAAVLSIAASLMAMIYALGDVSGAHFNPAVTTAILVTGKIEAVEGLKYIATQLIGGLAAGASYWLLLVNREDSSSKSAFAFEATGDLSKALVGELIATFTLAYVVLCVAMDLGNYRNKQATDLLGFIIGACVICGGLAVGPLSGGSLNPAVTVGASVLKIFTVNGAGASTLDWIFYIPVELLGGALAAFFYKYGTHSAFFSAALVSEEKEEKEELVHVRIHQSATAGNKYAAEFIGTFLLVFTVGMVVPLGQAVWGVFAIAMVLMVMIYALGPISGGNFNPAVSFALFFQGALDCEAAVMYIIWQLFGGLTGAWTACKLVGFENAATVAPGSGATLIQALGGEYFYTWMLVFVVMNVAVAKAVEGNQYFGLAIALVVVAGGYGEGALSGGAFNPAVGLGLNLVSFHYSNGELEFVAYLGRTLLYVLVHLVASFTALVMFHIVRPESKTESTKDIVYKLEGYCPPKLTSELLGTFMLVLTVGLNVLNPAEGGSQAAVISIAASLMAMIFALGDVSGAHFNPAVTFAIFATDKIDNLQALKYISAQLIGGLAAGTSYWLLLVNPEDSSRKSTFAFESTGDLTKASIGELIATFTLAYVVLCVAMDLGNYRNNQAKDLIGFIIGACVICGGLAVGPLSGGSLNPAVTVGASVLNILAGQAKTDTLAFDWVYYIVFELLGAALAAFFYRHGTHSAFFTCAEAMIPLPSPSPPDVGEHEKGKKLIPLPSPSPPDLQEHEKGKKVHLRVHVSASATNKYAAEFIGTLLLVFTVGMVVPLGQAVWGVFAIAMVLMVMIYALAPISGANFNPAVTFALFCQGALDTETAGIYVISQLFGGFSGALIAGYFVGVDNVAMVGPGSDATMLQALGGEYFYTWMLVFVVLNVAVAPAAAGNQYFGLAIALVVVAGGYGEGALSGGAFNPAVSLGLNLASSTYGEGPGKFALLYPLVHIFAAFMAVIMFHIVRPKTKTDTTSSLVSSLEGYCPPKLMSELLGTFMLVLTVGLNVLSPAKGGSQAAVVSIAASLMAMIFALGDVSGAHFNPAVTTAILVSEKIEKLQALKYIAAQLIGGLAAGASYWLLLVDPADSSRKTSFGFHPTGNMTQALIGEVIATFTLAYVVLCVALDLGSYRNSQAKDLLGFTIGACVICGGLAVGPISGGSLNPAVTAGASVLNIFSGSSVPAERAHDWMYYMVFELIGGVVAALFYKHGTHSVFFKEYLQKRAKKMHICIHETASEANKYVAEFAGTFLLVFTVGMVVPLGQAIWGVFAIAMVLMVMIYALGPISGGNFNPAVTIALFFHGALDAKTAELYIVSQLFGGLSGALSAAYFVGAENVASVGPGHGADLGNVIQALGGEYIYTWMLVFVVLNVAVAKAASGNQYFGLAIALVVVAGGYGEGALSGGAFNPAVSLCLNLTSYLCGQGGVNISLLYPLVHIGASFTAVLMFHIVRPEEKTDITSGFVEIVADCFPAKLTSEVLGTFILVLTVGLNVLNPAKGGSPAAVVSIAASLMAMIFALGDVSGAHFNPAVTTAILVSEKIEFSPALKYIAAQLIGGLAAGACYLLLLAGPGPGVSSRQSTFAFEATEDLTKALLGEVIATFTLAYVVLCVAIDLTDYRNNQAKDLLGFTIGACVICGGLAVGPLSGGSLNPAVTAGASVLNMISGHGTKDGHAFDWLLYIVVELLGGALAALFYRYATHSAFFAAAEVLEEQEEMIHVRIHQVASPANKYAAEFIGTFLLVFTVGMVVPLGQAVWGVFAIAMVLMVMIYALGAISGGNFNPAVTFALFIHGAMDLKTAGTYAISQLIGGYSGALTAGYFVGIDKVATAGPGSGTDLIQALGGEYFYTWMLVFVVLNVAVAPSVSGNQYFGLAIALVVVAGGYGEGALSGGAFNPAVSLGLNLASLSFGEGFDAVQSLLYPVAQLTASFMAVVGYHLVRPEVKPDYTSGGFVAMVKDFCPPKLTSEVLGTFMLVLTVGLNVLSPAEGGSTAAVVSIAASLMAMIFALGDVSGAHFNPAVTIAILVTEKIESWEALTYIAAQLIGGLAAGTCYLALLVDPADSTRKTSFAFEASGDLLPALIGETVATFTLVYVVLCVAMDLGNYRNNQAKDLLGFIIGACVICGGLAVGPLSGGSLNPAVTVGASVLNLFAGHAKDTHSSIGLYVIFELLGGALAALFYKYGTHSVFFAAAEIKEEKAKAEMLHVRIHQAASPSNKYSAEFIGTFLLVFTVGMVVPLGQAVWGVFAIAMVLMVMIYALGPISGGNFNPAVTFALFFHGALDVEVALLYVVSQLSGGFSGALTAGYFVGFDKVATAGPGNGANLIQALGGEYFYTWLLVFVVLNVAVAPAVAGNQYFGLAIGLVVVAGGYGEGALSGGAFNPAVSLGLNFASYSSGGELTVGNDLLYVLVHIGASFTAVIMFHLVRPQRKTKATSGFEWFIDFITKLEPYCPPKLTSEFLGTFILVLTVGLNVLSPAKGGSSAAVVSIAASLMAMIFALGDVSGAHFNPAVTTAILVAEKSEKWTALKYILAQLIGGLAAGTGYWLLLVNSADSSRKSTFAFEPAGDLTKALIGEVIATFTLAYVVLCVALDLDNFKNFQSKDLIGFIIGACVICGGLAVGPLSGGSLNPAVTVGASALNMLAGHGKTDAHSYDWLTYIVAELLGGMLAAFFYKHGTHSTFFEAALYLKEMVHVRIHATASAANKYAAEFIGTFLLVFTVGMVVPLGSAVWGVFAIAMVLMVMVYALGPISGGNFNPAVTFALVLQGALDMKTAEIYVTSQLLGGFSGALTAGYFVGFDNVASVGPGNGASLIQAIAGEYFYTWMLVFVVLNVAVAPAVAGNQYFGLAIGLVVVAGGYGEGALSGGAFNPAVSMGLDLVSYFFGKSGESIWWGFGPVFLLYLLVHIGASFMAVIVFHIVRPDTRTDSTSGLVYKLEGYCPPKLTSELLGTFMLVLTVGLNVLNPAGSPAAVISIAASLMAMIFALGDVSGAHFNPAVTTAILVRRPF